MGGGNDGIGSDGLAGGGGGGGGGTRFVSNAALCTAEKSSF